MWKIRKNIKEKSPIPANKPKIPATALASFGSVVVVVEEVFDVVVEVSGVVVDEVFPALLIYILESDFREACHEKVWTMKSIPH
jgi:hypothetical protein